MASAVHHFERLTSRATATDTNFVTALTVSAADLSGAGFADNDEVLVLVWGLEATAGSTGNVLLRVTYNSAVQTNATTPLTAFGSAAVERNVGWMGRIDLATLADLDIDVASQGTVDAYLERATVTVIRLADFGTENTDWVWNKNTTGATHTTTYTDRAAVTIPASGGTQDWVIWGYAHIGGNQVAVNAEARIVVDGSQVAGDFSEEWESTSEERIWLMNGLANLSSSTHAVEVETRDDIVSTQSDYRESALFAFRKDVWTDIYFHAPGTVSVANATDVQVATLTNTLSATQDLLLFGEGNIDLDTVDTDGYMWIRQGGSTIIEPVTDDASGLSNVRSFDPTDEPGMALLAFLASQSGTLDLDLFAHHTGGATENLLLTSFLGWGMELAGGGAVDDTATPATVNTPASIPAATKTATAEKTATTINALAAVPAVTKTASALTTPATVNAVSSIPTPVTIGGTTVTPATVNAVAAISAVTKTASALASPATVNAPAAIPAAAASGSSGVTATPATVNAVVAVPTATRTASASKSATTVNTVAAVPSVTTSASATKNATTVNLVALVPAAAASGGSASTANPATVNTVASIPPATKTATSTKTATTVTAIAAVPLAVASVSATKTAVTITALVSIPATTRTATATMAAVTVSLVAGVPLVSVVGGLQQFYDMSSGSNLVGAISGGTGVIRIENG